MPPRDILFGSDTLTTAAYLAQGLADPGLAAWKADHPDWFEAGTWTPALSPASDQSQRAIDTTRATVGRDLHPLDPATISLTDFRTVVNQAKQQRMPLSAASAVMRSLEVPSSRDADTKSDTNDDSRHVAHTNPEGGIP